VCLKIEHLPSFSNQAFSIAVCPGLSVILSQWFTNSYQYESVCPTHSGRRSHDGAGVGILVAEEELGGLQSLAVVVRRLPQRQLRRLLGLLPVLAVVLQAASLRRGGLSIAWHPSWSQAGSSLHSKSATAVFPPFPLLFSSPFAASGRMGKS
jgi:hypothetical protein